MQSRKLKLLARLGGALVLVALLPATARAQTVTVLTNCSQPDLEAALTNGGTITVNCDGTLLITNTITVSNRVVLDATGHRLTITSLGGANAVRLFTVNTGASFALINLTLAGGRSTSGGAIYNNRGFLTLENCVLSNNLAIGASGGNGSRGGDSDFQAGHDGRNGGNGRSAYGGAIYNLRGTTIVNRCSFLTNAATAGNGGAAGPGGDGFARGGDGGNGGNGAKAQGGAIFNSGLLYITNSTFMFNSATGGAGGPGGTNGTGLAASYLGHGGAGGSTAGGALCTTNRGRTFVYGSTFALNSVLGGDSANAGSDAIRARTGKQGGHSFGGAVANYGTNAYWNCTFFANRSAGGAGGNGGTTAFDGGRGGDGGIAYGGNLYSAKFATVTNCTFFDGGTTGGSGGQGGAATIAGRNGKGGARRGGNVSMGGGRFILNNSLIAFPAVPGANGYGAFKDMGFNLSSDRSIKLRGSGSMTNTDPLIGILGRNGGPTETIALFADSPAIDAGDTNFCLDFDQRGAARPAGDRCDIGAFEYGAAAFPPDISQHPQSQGVVVGSNVTFTVTAGGDPPLAYQWRHDGVPIEGATNSSLTLTNVQSADAGQYDVDVSNPVDTVTSTAATLTVVVMPVITTQPADSTVAQGASASFSVSATGGLLAYQWRRDGIPLTGATNATLTLTNVQPANAGVYSVVVTNLAGSSTSGNARLTVVTLPVITEQPAGTNVLEGQTAMFRVAASGASLAYQWRRDGNPITGATNAVLTLTNVQRTDAGAYTVIVSNLAGVVTSTNAMLTVLTPPAITEQPAGTNILQGQTAVFRVGATGGALTYHWRHDGAPITNTTGDTLTLTNAQPADSGVYDVVVSNSVSTVSSAGAMLQVTPVSDLMLAVRASAAFLSTNDPLAFVISVTNAGPSAASNLMVTCQVSAATQVLTVANTLGACTNDSGGVTCVISNLAAGENFTVTINVSASPGTNSCAATVTSDTVDPATANNSGAASAVTTSALAPFTKDDVIVFEEILGGAGSVYPSVINVSGLTGRIFKVTVTLHNVAHTWPDDLDILLVGPLGGTALLMSDCGLDNDISGVTLTFDDDAPGFLPDSPPVGAPIVSGTYRLSNYDANDVFPSPAPQVPYGSRLFGFRDSDPNGDWSLFAYDDTPENGGVIAEGWSLNLTLFDIEPTAQAARALPGAGASTVVTAAVIRRLRIQPGGTVFLEFTGTPSGNYTVQASATLDDWQRIGSVTAGSDGVGRFEDTKAPAGSCRFYRIVSQ